MKAIQAILMMILCVSVVFLSGCDEVTPSSSYTTNKDIETNQQRLIANYPVPQLTKSLERQNLIMRANVLNDENKVFYVYLMSYGKVVAFYVAKTKVSSLNSYLNPQEMPYRSSGGLMYEFTTDSPDVDGSYGKNADGVFFFTTSGAYVEWNGQYLVSDYPLKISTPVELTMEVTN